MHASCTRQTFISLSYIHPHHNLPAAGVQVSVDMHPCHMYRVHVHCMCTYWPNFIQCNSVTILGKVYTCTCTYVCKTYVHVHVCNCSETDHAWFLLTTCPVEWSIVWSPSAHQVVCTTVWPLRGSRYEWGPIWPWPDQNQLTWALQCHWWAGSVASDLCRSDHRTWRTCDV